MPIRTPLAKNPLFTVFITQDGSPTLEWQREAEVSEKMHHSGGALAESLYIYHEALELMLSQDWPARILSLGLGLGYNEWIALSAVTQRGLKDWKIWSFEREPSLREGFRSWLYDEPCPLNEVFQQVLAIVSARLGQDSRILKELMVRALQSGNFVLRGGFPDDATGVTACTCVFYDAFSKKMDPGLWLEPELKERLNKFTAPTCVLSTYAATGALNRALKSLGFRLLPKDGFLGKRESTLAIRGEFR